ncbi:hypothetical protein [Actinotalea sp. K2]|uniref:hypothetical protein n=1 Tax=Actinotalea sp. K2 TaxID=2939438 RepID=UPI002016D91D|nr:hypothetical protein [Actinotalea sp. K2]MCL3861135.1 hypothetical protein [Actinotalea sp. K2]
MDRQEERATTAVSVPMSSGAGMSPSFGVAAPIGAVSRKDRERAATTSLQQQGPTMLLLLTALPGGASLQRRDPDGNWETLDTRPVSRRGRTSIELPAETSPTDTFRVVFSPKNPNITAWISQDVVTSPSGSLDG